MRELQALSILLQLLPLSSPRGGVTLALQNYNQDEAGISCPRTATFGAVGAGSCCTKIADLFLQLEDLLLQPSYLGALRVFLETLQTAGRRMVEELRQHDMQPSCETRKPVLRAPHLINHHIISYVGTCSDTHAETVQRPFETHYG